jgi:transcriptional regulator with XRE-family HTH domain
MNFGEAIRSARKQRSWTQRDVANRAGIDQATLSHIESGRETTTAATARAICRVLGLGKLWPAVAAMEQLASYIAQQRGITRDEAFRELIEDVEQSTATGADGRYHRTFESFDEAQAFAAECDAKAAVR